MWAQTRNANITNIFYALIFDHVAYIKKDSILARIVTSEYSC